MADMPSKQPSEAESAPVRDPIDTPPNAPRAADRRISTTTGPERKTEDAPEVTVPLAPPTDKKLALGDSLTIIAKADREGKIRVLCSSMMDAAIAYPGQVVELRWVEGKVRLSIRREPVP